MSKFAVGDRVRKVTGYPFKGVVCAAYETEEKCCVKHADQWEHIFSDKQLDWDHPEYQYLDLLKEVKETGTFREGRNGGTRSLFAKQIRFNLKDGFPLLTTKRIHTKSVIGELIWFMKGSTNIKYLKDNGISIWDEWFCPYTIDRSSTLVDIRPAAPGGEWYAGNYSYRGICFPADSYQQKLATTWLRMMERCYKKDSDNYWDYGDKGVTVHPRWHECANFIEDVQNIPHWKYKLNDWNNFNLDKDYYNSNQYGPDTCVWLREDENNMYRSSTTPVVVYFPDGTSEVYVSQSDAARMIGIHTSTLNKYLKSGLPSVFKANNKKYIGYEFDYYEVPLGQVVRKQLVDPYELGPVYGKQWRDFSGVDQITKLIENLKTDPYSRRHIVSAWNPADVDQMALPPCHILFQFYVSDGKLSCHLYQRSADLFLGVPFNIASYSLLTHLIARETGLDVGEVVLTFGDVHLYENHVEQAQEQLTRRPLMMPYLHIPSDKKIFDLEIEDIEFCHYFPLPAIKAPVSK